MYLVAWDWGLAVAFLPGVAARAAPAPAIQDSPGSQPSANSGLGADGDLVNGLAPDSILPYGLLDGGKPQSLPST